jgi:DNA topoisomerase-1
MTKEATVIISEKPDASKRIAEALAEGKVEKKEANEAFWFEFKRKKKKFIVVPAVGHLFVLDTVKKKGGWNYPIFDVQWVPTHTKKGSEFSKKYFENMQAIVSNDNDYIIATDYDTEGSVIGYNILTMLAKKKDAKRMKFSTLTKDELVESFEKVSPHMDMETVESGLTRHYLDFYWGINLTRALTLAMKNAAEKGFAILSTGRVQGPTLGMLYDKELEIRKFKSTPFWEIELHAKIGKTAIIAAHEKDKFWKKEEAERVLEKTKGKDATVADMKKREYKQPPPVPFNTTELQSDSYSHFKFSPTQTNSIAESLYQSGIISYPRSSSQKLPPSINYVKILKALAAIPQYKKFAEELLMKEKLIPNEGKREDSAHPAVYPTFETQDLKKLTAQQKKLYDLIVRRFLSVFAEPATRESNIVTLDVNGEKFKVVGKRIIEPGWTAIYEPYLAYEEQILPDMKIGDKVKVQKIEQTAKETQPPGRFSQGSILKEMEERNLGTKATRAEILQTLYARKYILGKSIQVTKLGEAVTKALKDYSPRILSEDMTKRFEEEMDEVYKGKKKREEVIKEAKETLVDILAEFKQNEKKIGKKLLEALVQARKEERRLGTCPACKVGELRIIRSRKTIKFFVGCSSYPNCHNLYPLPQGAYITPLGKVCDKCNTPMIQVQRKGKRPFRMCLDPKCVTKADWGKPNKETAAKIKAIEKAKAVALKTDKIPVQVN